MKNHNRLFMIAGLCLLIMASCTKAKTTTTGTADPNAKQHNEDVSNVKSESDNVNTDVNNAVGGISGFGKNASIEAISICGAVIDSTHLHDATPYFLINFDGTTTCYNPTRIRSGQIKVALISGGQWERQGAMLKITHTNYKVTFPTLNNHYLTFNGIKYLTDVSGIDWIGIYFGTSVATIRERTYDMQVTFENGQVSSWNSARLSTWGIRNHSEIYATVNGDTMIGTKKIDSWGKTRFNTNFQTEMISPWMSSTTCGWWKPTQGKYTSTTDLFSITAQFGVDASGNAVTSGCPYGFKLDWNYNSGSVTGSSILSYF